MRKPIFFLAFFLLAGLIFSQGDCNNAAPFCTGTTYNFPAPVSGQNAQPGPDYGCLFSQPNPVWYYLQIANSGPITMNISGSSSMDDIDFVCWGPFTSPTGACTAQLTSNCSPNCPDNTTSPGFYPSGNMVDCSYDPQFAETCTIPNAIAGEYYMVMITNFGGNPTNIIFNQTNSTQTGAGSTNCNILCNITGMTATAGPCNAATNTFNITGTITTYAPPSSGTLTISSSCGGSTVLNPPFNTSINYTVSAVPATGGACTVTATYSADPFCTFTVNITAPPPCNASSCSISAVTATPGACNPGNNQYSVSGSITFANPPSSGTLNITSSCGGSQTINAPFSSPTSYTLTGLPSNGSTCTVTAVFSADAACTNTATFTAPAPCLTCTATATNNGPICEGQTLNLSSSPPGAISYSWSGPNSFFSPSQNPTLTNASAAASGVYTVTVNMPGGAICTATTSVTVNPSPAADAGPTVTICTGGSVTLNASGGTSYSWTPATGLSNNAISNPVASPAATTLYSVTVGSNGCFSMDTVSVFVVSQLNATVSPDATICGGQTTTLTAGGGSNYQWIPAAGLSSAIISNPVASPTVTTTYSVIVSASGGCPNDTAVVTVTVLPAMTLVVSANDTICMGDTGMVFASGAASYTWQPGGTTNDSLSASPLVTQTYTVTGSAGGCTDTASVTIVVIPQPVAGFTPSPQLETGNYSLCFTNISSGFTASPVLWNFGDSDSSSLADPCHVFDAEGTYNVCLTVMNSLGCPDTYCEDVILKPDWTVYIPNTFTPNDDGMNEVFYVYATNIAKFEMYIFDRWGNMVLHSIDISEGWNGRMNNKGPDIVQIDTYVYRVKITDSENKVHHYTGHVNVVK